MNKILMLSLLAFGFIACERADKPVTPPPPQVSRDVDNTEQNVRDRNNATKTPFDQSESELDRNVTQKIRQAIMADENFSLNAKNIKIITINGVVTLRGPVENAREKDEIIRKVSGVYGVKRVENQLEIIRQ